jgi:hypothetical protein
MLEREFGIYNSSIIQEEYCNTKMKCQCFWQLSISPPSLLLIRVEQLPLLMLFCLQGHFHKKTFSSVK